MDTLTLLIYVYLFVKTQVASEETRITLMGRW